jgi:uncharacterized protein YecE (DUF72 family)
VSAAPRVLIGIAGWSYEDWKDRVYPRNCKDTLRAVAARAPLIEVNSTFYAPPSARNCASWVERTADLGTFFTAKLPQEFTHAREFDQALVDRTREGFAPLFASGRCLGLLAQFNHEFECTPASVELVQRLADGFAAPGTLFVELRHRSWNAPQAMAALAALPVSVAALDYPAMASGFSRDVPPVHGPADTVYFRIHGRNRAWFRKGAGRDEVYDYEYSAREVEQLRARIERITAAATRALVVANNHFHGKAMKLVEELLAWYRDAAT